MSLSEEFYRNQPSAPRILTPDFAGIEKHLEPLTKLPNWCLHRAGHLDEAGEPDKRPRRQNGNPASSTDPSTWSSYEAVKAAYEANRERFSGVGFVFAQEHGFAGVDIDHCLLPSGQCKFAWQQELLNSSATYTERSVSGKGLHQVARNTDKIKFNFKDKKQGAATSFEGYSDVRFFITTGRPYGSPAPLAPLNQSAVSAARDKRRATINPSKWTGPLVEEFLYRTSQTIWRVERTPEKVQWTLEQCFDNPEHRHDAAFFLFPDGSLIYKCFHEKSHSNSGEVHLGDFCKRYAEELKDFPLPSANSNRSNLTAEQLFPSLGSLEFPLAEVLVEDLLVRGRITAFTGLPGSYKTLTALHVSGCLISGKPVSGHFQVKQRADVLFLSPDMGAEQLNEYAQPFGLREAGDKFRILQTNAEDSPYALLDDGRLHEMARNRVVVMDTLWDFASIKEAGQSNEWGSFFHKLRRLMTVHGCLAIILILHPTKSVEKQTTIQAGMFIKDSVTLWGKLDFAFAFAAIKNKSLVFVERIKTRLPFMGRDFRFVLTMKEELSGANCLDEGRIPLFCKPHETKNYADYLPTKPKARKLDGHEEEAARMKTEGLTHKQIAIALGVSPSAVDRLFQEKRPTEKGDDPQMTIRETVKESK